LTTTRARLLATAAAIAAAVAVTTTGSAALADGSHAQNNVRERLAGYAETPLALSTAGSGQFRLQINEKTQTITYQLSYTGLEGTVTQSHIHFGSAAQSGGISVFLCTNLGNGPAGTQPCPAAPGAVTGTLTPASVIGPAGQGIAAGEFAELIAAIRAGSTYVNVHSTLYPAGEIRAQLVDHF
jgi:hypothetical protein